MSSITPSNSIKKLPRKIGFDLSVLDRVETGTSVYALNLFQTLKTLEQDDFEFIAIRAPRPLPRKNIVTKFCNFLIEVFWLTVLLPIKSHRLHLDLLHMPANIISPVTHTPQICTIHDAHFITNPKGRDPLWRLYAHWSFRYAARRADKIICVSNSGKAEVVKYLGAMPTHIEVVHQGLPHRVSQPSDLKATKKYRSYILSVGVTDPNKNLPTLVRAYARLSDEDPDFQHKLILTGPPGHDHPKLEKLIHQKRLDDKVMLLGRVSDSRLAALYENASIFVFPSFCEGFGFPPLEAMSYGVPVLASNAPCIPETLGEAALYFSPDDIAELTEKLHLLLSDPQLCAKLIQAGHERAKKFTWESTAEKTRAVYRSTLS